MTQVQKWDGKPIFKAGAYTGIPMSDYHRNPNLCIRPSISSTGLKQILENPQKYWAFSPYNPDRIESQSNAAFDFGRAAHSVILEGRLPRREYAVSPYADFRTKAAQEWKAKAERLGLTILKADDLNTIAAMYQQIARHPIVEAGGLDGEVEVSLIWPDPVTGYFFKARPDVLPMGDMIINYKTCSDASLRAVAQSVIKYRYDISEALAAMGMAATLKRQVTNVALLNQEKSPPYVVSCFEFSDQYLAVGTQMVREAMDTFARCMESGEWPSFADDNSTIVPPSFIVSRAFGDAKADLGVLDDLTESDDAA